MHILSVRLLLRLTAVFAILVLGAAACSADESDIATIPAAAGFDDDQNFDDEYDEDENFDDEYDEDENFDEDEYDEGESTDEAEYDEDEAFDDEYDTEGESIDEAVADGATTAPSAGPDTFPGGGVDLSKSRSDTDCSEEGLGEDDSVDFTLAHYVVDGDLGAVCFGDPDPRLVSAWETLAKITPSGQLLDLALFGGFASTEGGDETTLAFVNILDDAGSIFQMSVNLDSGDEDPNELILTMAHEFSHVFTALSTQLDRLADPEDCATFDNGEGCYLQGSLMAEWIELFWGNGLIDEIDPSAEATAAAGQQRCDLNPGFFGAYAASSPEEDFAESFSSYVFRLEVDSGEQQDKMDWFSRQPGLVEFQQLAIEAGLGPLQNNFDYCG